MHMRRGAGAAVLSVLLLTSLLTSMGWAASNGGDGSGEEEITPNPGIVTPSHPFYNQDKAFDYWLVSYGFISPAVAIYERVSELATINESSQYKAEYLRMVTQGVQQVEAYASSNQSESLQRVLTLLDKIDAPDGTKSRIRQIVQTAQSRNPEDAKEAAFFTGENKLKGLSGFGNSIMDFLQGFGDFLGG